MAGCMLEIKGVSVFVAQPKHAIQGGSMEVEPQIFTDYGKNFHGHFLNYDLIYCFLEGATSIRKEIHYGI